MLLFDLRCKKTALIYKINLIFCQDQKLASVNVCHCEVSTCLDLIVCETVNLVRGSGALPLTPIYRENNLAFL